MRRDIGEQSTGDIPLPKGLVFFSPEASKGSRRRRQVFVWIYLIISSFVVWPVYSRFSEPFPLILGLPQSLVWIIFSLALMFVLLLWFFLTEDAEES